MRKARVAMRILVAILLCMAVAQADTISVNFVGGGASLNASDLAGLVDPTDPANLLYAATYVANWNNLSGTTGSGVPLNLSSGAPSGATVDWTTALGTWSLPGAPTTTGNDKMWSGYLDADGNASSVTFNGLIVDPARGSYDVFVYFDGDNGGNWRVAQYTIGVTSLSGEDSENTNWKATTGQNTNGYFQIPASGSGGNLEFLIPPPGRQPNNGEGNYVVFASVSSASFTLNAVGTAGSPLRAPINGIQIVGVVPEPTTLSLLALAGLAAVLRRRSA